MTHNPLAAFCDAARELSELVDHETGLLDRPDGMALLPPVVEAKVRLADRLMAAASHLDPRALHDDERQEAAMAWQALAARLEQGNARVGRRLEFMQGLLAEMELAIRALGGRNVVIYDAGGRQFAQRPSPLAIDASL
jgi:hypothetical protein